VRREDDVGRNPSNRAAFVLGASAGLFALLVHSAEDFNLQIPANAVTAVTLMALLSSHLRHATDRYRVPRSRVLTVLVSLILLLAGGYLGQQAWVRGREYVWLRRAAQENLPADARIEALEGAVTVEPMNAETAYSLGDAYRRLSWQGDSDYEKWARQAIEWFSRGMRLNPYDPYCPMRRGMCLDWLGLHEEAAPFFRRAVALDPNNYYVLAHMGWHWVQTGDYAAARSWFERSLLLHHGWHNPIASTYLEIVERRLKEQKPPKAGR
jgi:tetratricopeptide (TPR) repeat protein